MSFLYNGTEYRTVLKTVEAILENDCSIANWYKNEHNFSLKNLAHMSESDARTTSSDGDACRMIMCDAGVKEI